MQPEFIRIYKTVHTWTGIITGLALFITFYAAALTMFKEPISRWASPPSKGVNAVSLEDTPELITKTITAHPAAAKSFYIYLDSTEDRLGRMEWEIAAEGSSDLDQLSLKHHTSTLDSEHKLSVMEVQKPKLAIFIDVLHRVVGLPVDNDITRLIMGVIAVLYSIALISGLVVLLPTLVKDFCAFRIGKNIKRMWLDAHNVVGIMSFPFHIVMALTAIAFAYHDIIYISQDKMVLNGQLRAAFQAGVPVADLSEKKIENMLPPKELVAKTQALSPNFKPTMLQYVGVTESRPMVRIWGNDATTIGARAWGGFLILNPYTGKVISTDYMPRLQSSAFTTVSSFFALHFATYGGILVKWLYFFLAMAGAWLFYSGNLLWLESRRKKQRNQGPTVSQRRDVYYMACSTVGVSFGCIAGLSITIAATKWFASNATNLSSLHQLTYYSVFFVSIAWAFIRGPGKASIDLLWLAALTTFLIPITSLLAWLVPDLGMWNHGSTPTISVDIVAFIGGACYLYLALKIKDRVYNSSYDSVWSINNKGL